MSHTYYITSDNAATGTQIASVGLSNESHEAWMFDAGLVREMRNTESGAVETWPFSTTVHDKEPLSVYSYEFEVFVETAQEALGDNESPDHMQMLYDFFAEVEAHEQETGLTYQVWLY